MFETVIKSLDFNHFASGSHKIAFADFFRSREGIFLDGGYPALAAELLPGKLRKHKLKKRPLEVA